MKILLQYKSIVLTPESEAEKCQIESLVKKAEQQNIQCSHTEQWGTQDVWFPTIFGQAKGKLMGEMPDWTKQ